MPNRVLEHTMPLPRAEFARGLGEISVTAPPDEGDEFRAAGGSISVGGPGRGAGVRRERKVSLPQVASRDQWLVARKELLVAEKELTRARDALSARRRALPMVAVKEEYVFDSANGQATLLDMFEGRRQLIIYHFMFGPDDNEGHNACSILVDGVGHLSHLHARNTTLALVSRAPIEKLERFRARMDWAVPWYSSAGSRWNYDFHATMDESIAPVEYNYQDAETLRAAGKPWYTSGDWHGLSVFLREGEEIFHTYSTYERGLEMLLSPYNYLDLTPLGRQDGIDDFKVHDSYTPEDLAGKTA
jgi:predicted dithiol-disulfide oxidoreductase (DUF899 family)